MEQLGLLIPLLELFLAQCVSLVVAVLLPSVGVSLYFYSVPKNPEESGDETTRKQEESPAFSYKRAFSLLWRHFLQSYSNPTIVQWSLWWSLATAGFLMVQIYVQLLWQLIIGDDRQLLLNAGVEALLTLFGAIAAFVAGFLSNKSIHKFDLWILMVCSLLEGIFVIISSQTSSIWLAYSMYVLFGVLYMFMITIASATVAQKLADDTFALIFGINTLVALIFQTILTVVVITYLGLSTRDQFLVYGIYFVVLSGMYLVTALVKLIFCRNSNNYAVRD